MNLQENLLTTLGEEASEIIKDCSKANRFGLGDINPETGISSKEAIQTEINDLLGVAAVLVDEGFLDEHFINEKQIQAKKTKIQKYLDYSRDQGSLDE